MPHHLKEVLTKELQKEFLRVAARVNSGEPNWVQPLDVDIERVFDPAHNAMFSSGEAIRWVLFDDAGAAIGRIAAFYNTESSAKEEQPTGGCGFFECIDDFAAASVLFDAARDWLMGKGMEAMDGSINFGDRMSWWGVLVEGFSEPLYGMNHNPPYYAALFERYGFENYFNQHTYLRLLDDNVRLNPAVIEKAERLFANSEYSFRSFDKGSLRKMAEDFREVYNSGWAKFEGVKPLTSEHAWELMLQMKPIIDPEVIIFAYHSEKPVGFFVMLPDLNQLIRGFKGRFGLWQKLALIIKLKFLRRVNRLSGIVFGVAAEYQGKGVEAGMIRYFEKYTQKNSKYKSLEMGWIGDFNPVMMRMCESYVMATKFKRHVTYRYLFDRDRPFKRCPRLGKN